MLSFTRAFLIDVAISLLQHVLCTRFIAKYLCGECVSQRDGVRHRIGVSVGSLLLGPEPACLCDV